MCCSGSKRVGKKIPGFNNEEEALQLDIY